MSLAYTTTYWKIKELEKKEGIDIYLLQGGQSAGKNMAMAVRLLERAEDENIFRDTIVPFVSTRDSADEDWVHTDTDVSGKDSRVQAICNAAWTDDMKNAYKDWANDNLI